MPLIRVADAFDHPDALFNDVKERPQRRAMSAGQSTITRSGSDCSSTNGSMIRNR